jgi:hypothetical protein
MFIFWVHREEDMRLIIETELIIDASVSWKGPGSLLVHLSPMVFGIKNRLVKFVAGACKEWIWHLLESHWHFENSLLYIKPKLKMHSSVRFELSKLHILIHPEYDIGVWDFGGNEILWSEHINQLN